MRRRDIISKKEINILEWTKRNQLELQKTKGEKFQLERVKDKHTDEES